LIPAQAGEPGLARIEMCPVIPEPTEQVNSQIDVQYDNLLTFHANPDYAICCGWSEMQRDVT
jgi:hypothetical protein